MDPQGDHRGCAEACRARRRHRHHADNTSSNEGVDANESGVRTRGKVRRQRVSWEVREMDGGDGRIVRSVGLALPS